MEQATALELARLDRRLEPVLEPEMRRALVREWLAESDVDEACRVAGAAFARTRPADALRRRAVRGGGGSDEARLPGARRTGEAHSARARSLPQHGVKEVPKAVPLVLDNGDRAGQSRYFSIPEAHEKLR